MAVFLNLIRNVPITGVQLAAGLAISGFAATLLFVISLVAKRIFKKEELPLLMETYYHSQAEPLPSEVKNGNSEDPDEGWECYPEMVSPSLVRVEILDDENQV